MGNFCSPCSSITQNTITPNQSFVPENVMEGKIQNCVIRINQGDLLKTKCDGIVAIVDPQLSFHGQLCRHILKLAGKSLGADIHNLQMEKKNYMEYGQVFHTHAGDLDFDFIFFAVLPPQLHTDTDEYLKRTGSIYSERSMDHLYQQMNSSANRHQRQYVFQCINEILRQADELGLTSVAFPVISDESIHSSKNLTAMIMLMGIKAFIEEHPQTKLQLIIIAILDKHLVPIFKLAFDRIIYELPDESNISPDVNQKQINANYANQLNPPKRQSFASEQNQNDTQDGEFLRFGHRCQTIKKSRLIRKDSI